MKKGSLLSRTEMKSVMGGKVFIEDLDTVKKYKCCPEGYSQGSSGAQIVCSDCSTGTYCTQGTLVSC